MKNILTIILLGFLLSCNNEEPKPKNVPLTPISPTSGTIDISKLVGDWYLVETTPLEVNFTIESLNGRFIVKRGLYSVVSSEGIRIPLIASNTFTIPTDFSSIRIIEQLFTGQTVPGMVEITVESVNSDYSRIFASKVVATPSKGPDFEILTSTTFRRQ